MSTPMVPEALLLLSDSDEERDTESGLGSAPVRRGLRLTTPVCTTGASMLLMIALLVAGTLMSAVPRDRRQSEHILTSSLLLNQEVGVSRAKVFQVMAQGAESCENYPHLKLLETRHNNLGGFGPDGGKEGIRYLAQLGGHGKSEKMLIDVHAGTTYHPESPVGNGLSVGESSEVTEQDIKDLCEGGRCDSAMSFGTINIHSGTSVNLTFEFFDLDYQPRYLKELGLTWFDLDHAGCSGGAHCRPEAVESVIPMGNFEAYLTSTTRVKYEFKNEYAVFSAKDKGYGPDNPINSRLLTQEQIDKAVTSMYKNVHQIMVTLAATKGGDDATARYFFFDFVPSLLCAETLKEWPSWTKHEHAAGDAPAAPSTITTTTTTRKATSRPTTSGSTTATTTTTTTTTSSGTSTSTTTTLNFVAEKLASSMECLPAHAYARCERGDAACLLRRWAAMLRCWWWAVALALLPTLLCCLMCLLCRCLCAREPPAKMGLGAREVSREFLGQAGDLDPQFDADFPRKISLPLSKRPAGDDH